LLILLLLNNDNNNNISKDQIPSWEADICSTKWEIPSIHWKPKVHYRVHKNPALVSIKNKMAPVHTLPFWLFKIHFIILLSAPRTSDWSCAFRYSYQNFICSSIPSMWVTCPVHLVRLQWYWWRVQLMKLLIIHFVSAWCHFLSLRSKRFSQHPVLEDSQSIFVPNVRDVVPHPYKTTGKIIVFYIFIFMFLYSRPEGKTFRTGSWMVSVLI
jgi:hypothetical protein